ncbi:MAG: hypothetical protein IK079_01430 [Desulfovibrio sp.]|nr:hypothetical protein [Desulfovibrio sp.]
MKYGESLRESTLRRILPPKSESLSQVSRDTGISIQTLFNWRKKALSEGKECSFEEEKDTSSYSSEEKFLIVVQAESLNESDLAEFARSKGVFVEQIKTWRETCKNANDVRAVERRQFNQALKEKERLIMSLQADIDRKDKALAELVALDVLKKKANSTWAGLEED